MDILQDKKKNLLGSVLGISPQPEMDQPDLPSPLLPDRMQKVFSDAVSPYAKGQEIAKSQPEIKEPVKAEIVNTANQLASGKIKGISDKYVADTAKALEKIGQDRDAYLKASDDLYQKAQSNKGLSKKEAVGLALLTLVPTALGGLLGGKAGVAIGGTVGVGAGSNAFNQIQKEREAEREALIKQADRKAVQAEGVNKVLLDSTLGMPEKEAAFGLKGVELDQSAMEREASRIAKAESEAQNDSEKFNSRERSRIPSLQAYKDYAASKTSQARMQNAVQNASAFGDISAIFDFFKSIDPTSVVRESEFATGEQAGALLDRVKNRYSRFASGQRLTPEQRNEILGLLKHTNSVLLDNYVDTVRPTIEAAKKNKADLAEILPFHDDVMSRFQTKQVAPKALSAEEEAELQELEKEFGGR